MSDPTSNETPPTTVNATNEPPIADRSSALVALGVIEIILGGLCGLMMVFMGIMLLAMPSLPHPPGQPQPSMGAMLPAVSIYGLWAVSFIFIGIGTVRAKRWARRLNVIFSTMWLIAGGLMLLGAIVVGAFVELPPQPGVPPMMMGIVILVMAVVVAIFFVALPGSFLLFFRSRGVVATCERRSPPDWSDAVPMSVLGLAALLAHYAYMLLAMSWTGAPTAAFGHVLGGAGATAFNVAQAALWAVLTLGVYQRRKLAWWGTLAATLVLTLGNSLTMTLIKPDEFAKMSGLPPGQPLPFNPSAMLPIMLVCILPLLIFIVWTRKHFTK